MADWWPHVLFIRWPLLHLDFFRGWTDFRKIPFVFIYLFIYLFFGTFLTPFQQLVCRFRYQRKCLAIFLVGFVCLSRRRPALQNRQWENVQNGDRCLLFKATARNDLPTVFSPSIYKRRRKEKDENWPSATWNGQLSPHLIAANG